MRKTCKSYACQLVVASALLFFSNAVNAQHFGKQVFRVPVVGWLLANSSLPFLSNGSPQIKLNDEFLTGLGYSFSVYDYKLWITTEFDVGFGTLAPDNSRVVSINASTGLRYNFLDQKIRPFVGLTFEYFQAFTSSNSFNGYQLPASFGFRPNGGLEWIFASEMSFQAELGFLVLFNLDGLDQQAGSLRISYNLYY